MLRRTALCLAALLPFAATAVAAPPGPAPSEIKIGGLHASSGLFAAISMPVYYGLKLWAHQMNAEGGVYVKAYNKRIPVRLISYDDESNPATAATLTNQLITEDKVNILTSDSGSVLTAVSVPIAEEHKMLLFDLTGTGGTFFTKDNPYVVLLADPVSTVWPKYIAEYLKSEGAAAGLKRVAVLYSTNDFTGTQAVAVKGFLTEPGSPVEIVYDHGVPTNTTNYTVLTRIIQAAHPDAVIELGYPNNDIAFLRNLETSGANFRFVFAVYPGLETDELTKAVGVAGLTNIFTYASPNTFAYKTSFGMNLPEYEKAWNKAYPSGKVAFGFNAVAGYASGLIIEKTLATATSLAQLDLRKALGELSGKLDTLDGPYAITAEGAQIGETTPLGQLVPNGKGGLKMAVVYPPNVASAKAVLGK
ncbi:MAG: ABC transporter substrate-binding protein [Acetobacteraceae bacterium]